jgi:hypothetical protein
MFAGSPTTLLVVDEVLADLESQQAQLLIDIIDGPLISVGDRTSAEVLPISAEDRKPPNAQGLLGAKGERMLR